MITRSEMMEWLYEVLEDAGGKATIRYLAKEIWIKYQDEIKASDNLLYTWQYDMRWAAYELRKAGRMAPVSATPYGIWALKDTP